MSTGIDARRTLIILGIVALMAGVVMTYQARASHSTGSKITSKRDQHVSVQVHGAAVHLPDPASVAPVPTQSSDSTDNAFVSVNQGSTQTINNSSNSSSTISVSSSSSNSCSIQTSGAVGTHNETTSNGSFNWSASSADPNSSSVSVNCH